LEKLVTHRLLTFDAVRLLECRQVEPAVRAHTFRDARTCIRDETTNQLEVCAERARFLDDWLWRVARDDDVRDQACRRCVRRRRRARIASGWQGDFCRTQLLRARHSHDQTTSLEAARRILAFIFDPD